MVAAKAWPDMFVPGTNDAFSGMEGQARGGRSGSARSTDVRRCWSNGTVMEGAADTGSTAMNDGAMATQEPHVAQAAHLPA